MLSSHLLNMILHLFCSAITKQHQRPDLNKVAITHQSQNKAMMIETKLVVNQVSPDNEQQTSCIAAM